MRVVAKLGLQNLQGYVVVVKLVLAEGYVDVECDVLPVVQQQALVDVCGFFEVRSRLVDGCQTQLVGCRVRQILVLRYESVFIHHFLGYVEQHSGL